MGFSVGTGEVSGAANVTVVGVCSVGLAHTNHGPFLSCSWNVGWSVNKFIVFHPDKKEGKSEESQGPMLIFASLKGFFWTQGEKNLLNYLEKYLMGFHRHGMR